MVPPDDDSRAEASHQPGRLERLARALDEARTAADHVRRSVASPSGVRGVAVEVAWWTAHLAMWPFSILEERTQDVLHDLHLSGLSPEQRALVVGDVEAAGTPIVLLHGVGDNRSIFALLRRALGRRGFGRVIGYNYSPFTSDIREVAAELADAIETVCAETGYERIHVVAHSMGGLVARYYVQCLGGDERVHTLVTLGTPHEGSHLARLVPHPLARQLRPDSDLLAELEAPAPQCRTRFLAIWSDLDQVVVPPTSARLDRPDLRARSVLVRGVGHQSLPVDGRVIHEIVEALAHLEHDGSQSAAGVTSLTSEAPSVRDAAAAGPPRRRNSRSTGTR